MTNNNAAHSKAKTKFPITRKNVKCTFCNDVTVEAKRSSYYIPQEYQELNIYICDKCKHPFLVEDISEDDFIAFSLSPGILGDPNELPF